MNMFRRGLAALLACALFASSAIAQQWVSTSTARGTTITVGGTSQTLAAANPLRRSLVIQNPCSAASQGIAAAENIVINLTSAATINGSGNFAELPPCYSMTLRVADGVINQELITVNAATTGHIIYAKEFQ